MAKARGGGGMSGETDGGEVSGGGGRLRYLWAWVFPLLAGGAALWMLWRTWASQGPEIVIFFDQAPGVFAGRTPLLFRGFPCGEVTGVRLSGNLSKVEVSVRLKAFAAGLAREGTQFWIEQPVISLMETAGLEALIQGNSLRARAGGGPPRREFQGLDSPPLEPLEDPALSITLRARGTAFVERGAPVYHKGSRVGMVVHKSFDSGGVALLQVNISKESAGLVRTNSRFWVLPAAVARFRGRAVEMRIPGLQSLVGGGVAFEEFSGTGEPARDGAVYELHADRAAARAEGPPLRVVFDEVPGVVAGETPVEWFGQPAGVVEEVKVPGARGGPELTIRLTAEAAPFAREGARFVLERARVGLDGVSGLETLLSGPVVKFYPGSGAPKAEFAGESGREWEPSETERRMFRIRLVAKGQGAARPGAPVYHGGLLAGRVLSARGLPDGGVELEAGVAPDFVPVLSAATRFWRQPLLRTVVASGKFEVELEGLEAVAGGGVCFANYGTEAGQVGEGAKFELFDNEELAAAVSPPVRIRFADARGLAAGRTELRYLGSPVGVVTDVELKRGVAEVTARFRRGFDFLRAAGSRFELVKPGFSLEGFTGLETFISGIYIECVPGSGPPGAEFAGAQAVVPAAAAARESFTIFLECGHTAVRPGAPVLHREMPIGNVLSKELAGDGVRLVVGIQEEHKGLVRENSRFVDASGVRLKVGPLPVRVPAHTLLDPAGKIELVNPRSPGPPAVEGSTFKLQPGR